ncbi:MAG: glycerophosphodiester phosphodiesterase family protein, partial [Gemmatimonadales bacterium]
MRPTLGSILVESLRDFRRTWPQLILTDFLARVLGIVILTPALGLLLEVFLARTTTGVITDLGILKFLVHPIGLMALVLVGAVSAAIKFAETGQLMVIGFGAIENRSVTWLAAFQYAWRRAPALVRLAGHAFVRLLLIVLPFLAALGALYWYLLRGYDINYYLAERPPEFLAAAAVAGLLLLAMVGAIVIKIAGWLLALPMVLFEDAGGMQALRASETVTYGARLIITLWLFGWIIAIALASALVTFIAGSLFSVLVPRDGSNLVLLAAGLIFGLVLTGLANLVLAVLTTVWFPLLVVRLYRCLAGPGELRPAIAAPGSLGKRPSVRLSAPVVLWSALAALVIVGWGGYWVLQNLGATGRAEIIAHRGGAALAPENTLAAFQRGIADGADWLELDVQENAEGVVIVQHDRDFMRSAGVELQVWNATEEDLAKLDIGSFFGPEFADQRVPTLRDVLELAKGRVGVFIELKYYGHDRDLEAKVVDVVEGEGMESDIVIMSLEY